MLSITLLLALYFRALAAIFIGKEKTLSCFGGNQTSSKGSRQTDHAERDWRSAKKGTTAPQQWQPKAATKQRLRRQEEAVSSSAVPGALVCLMNSCAAQMPIS